MKSINLLCLLLEFMAMQAIPIKLEGDQQTLVIVRYAAEYIQFDWIMQAYAIGQVKHKP